LIGVRPVTTTTDVRDLVTHIDFCWLDVSVGDEAVRTDVLAQLSLDASDLSWTLPFPLVTVTTASPLCPQDRG
jgi:hypothetical protein